MFDWDNANIEHIAEHGLEAEDVEEAFTNRTLPAAAYNVPGEKRFALLGETDAGRILYVVYTKRAPYLRVATARDATRSEKRRYKR